MTSKLGTTALFITVLILLIGCRADVAEPAVDVISATSPAATIAPSPAPKSISPPAINTSAPQQIVLAIPEDWTIGARLAIESLNVKSDLLQWHVLVSDHLAESVANGEAQVALVSGDAGVAIQGEALALAVPLTMDWDGVTLQEAQGIYSAGHPAVTVRTWSKMEPTQRALRVDGMMPDHPNYPLRSVDWSLVGPPGYEYAIAQLVPALQATIPPNSAVHLTAVGDIMLDRGLGQALARGSTTVPFAAVTPALQSADLTIGNFESTLGYEGQPVAKSYAFHAPPQAATALALAGFDVVTLANNHALDYGPQALLEGIALLHEQGIDTIGAGHNADAAHHPLIRRVNDITLAMLAYVNVRPEAGGFDTESWAATVESPGVAWATQRQIQADVAAVREQVDIVIVSLHSGTEFQAAPSESQVRFARSAVDAGADLIIGHHAHVLQGIEFYNDGVILYGLGNFAFDNGDVPQTAIFNVWLGRNGVRQLEVVPAIVGYGGQPRLATVAEASTIKRRVYELTRLLNGPLQSGE